MALKNGVAVSYRTIQLKIVAHPPGGLLGGGPNRTGVVDGVAHRARRCRWAEWLELERKVAPGARNDQLRHLRLPCTNSQLRRQIRSDMDPIDATDCRRRHHDCGGVAILPFDESSVAPNWT